MKQKESKNTDASRIYADIIHLPHHVSDRHPQMPLKTRAAQFLPFAALTGYDAAVEETARLTEAKADLDEMRKSELNEKLLILQSWLPQKPPVRITFFKKDEKKSGGAYLTAVGNISRIDPQEGMLLLSNGSRILIEDITEIESDALDLSEESDLLP